MKFAVLAERFYRMVAPDIPNEWEVEEVMEPLLEESDEVCEEILSQVPVIWQVSNSLCYDFLRISPDISRKLSLERIGPWLGAVLDRYETDGLKAAQRFMREDISGYLARLEGSGGLSLAEVEKRLLPYLRGISRDELRIEGAAACYTDTSTIYLPREIDIFSDQDLNFLVYKLMVSFQWGFIACGSFSLLRPEMAAVPPAGEGRESIWLQSFFESFPDFMLARDIYHNLESIRVSRFLSAELPGLMRKVRKLLLPQLPAVAADHPLADLQAALLTGDCPPGHLCSSVTESAAATRSIFDEIYQEEMAYQEMVPLIFQGSIRLMDIARASRIREREKEEKFAELLVAHLMHLDHKELTEIAGEEKEHSGAKGLAESDISMVMDSEFAGVAEQEKSVEMLVSINNEEVQLPDDLKEFARKFIDEFGHLPVTFIGSAVGKSGDAMLDEAIAGTAENGEPAVAGACYDEWDYRRQGYRKNWCSLSLKSLKPVYSPFIANTLRKYHGLIVRLRHQFEMMRSQERFVRRQREGEDIDLDAVVEAISDRHAGVSSSDRLFIRLQRDERDIAAIFLIDMSNSTSGWVNNVIKESLLLMAEAMAVLGDRYAIYGFSGMRRSRCEFFHVKHLNEPYNEEVRDRISFIAPSEYTRMGPPIRHATRLLQDVDAKVRLLIVLSDGKPEDYDDYKGEYAIEDTRHALLEAKNSDIHPFCISIDKQANDYLEHMYGPANYIFIDSIHKLPLRMVEIYRILTT